MRRLASPCLLALAPLLSACAGDPAVAASLANAARPSRLPEVVACWEKEFEAAEFQGEYTAEVDFVLERGTNKIHDAKVRSLEPIGAAPGRDTTAFKACLEAALNKSALPASADGDGPGFSSASDLDVSRFRIAFTDSPTRKKAVESKRQAHVLLGPRADRCQGLYSHDPPRDAGTLYEEISQSEAKAASYAGDADRRARELQKIYDLELELGERLRADLAQPGLPEANKKRLRKALSDAEDAAKRAGAKIGCSPKRSP